MTSGIPNQNPWLYGPGPFKRVPTGPAAGPPLAGLVKVCLQGLVLASAATFAVKKVYVDPQRRAYKEYYEKHP